MTTSSSVLKKACKFASRPDASTFPELITLVTWLRIIIGAMYGVSLGIRNENRGLVGLTLGLNVIAFAPMLYFNGYLMANVDSYKNLRFVGVVNGLAIMLLIWITFFTWAHSEEEISMQKVLTDAMIAASEDSGSTEETSVGTDEF
mmetsp:Transcript_622/g.974  ORF Transcript_622/g.974 Transcript_622/m.974 type:complete len:146 (+) Transcript_622:40-477(+)